MAASFTIQWSDVYRDRMLVKGTPVTPLRTLVDEVCRKHGFDVNACALEYKKRRLDLSLTVRFANLPNGAVLDLIIDSERKDAAPSSVNIALQLPDGTRRVQMFPATTTLWSVLEQLRALPAESEVASSAVCNILNTEYTGETQLRAVALRDAGLTAGTGMIRLRFAAAEDVRLEAAPEPTPAAAAASTEHARAVSAPPLARQPSSADSAPLAPVSRDMLIVKPHETFRDLTQLEVPESFYEMDETLGRMLLTSYSRKIKELEEAPLQTQAMRERLEEQRAARHKNAIIRVRFPDQMILQGTFAPNETVGAVYDFVAEHVAHAARTFTLFVTPPRQVLGDRSQTLVGAGLVPTAVVNFSWSQTSSEDATFLRSDLVDKAIAPALPVDYTVMWPTKPAPSKEAADDERMDADDGGDGDAGRASSASASSASGAAGGKVPKWLKLSKS